MASSGTIDGTRSGTRPYLRIRWNIDQTDISGNRSRLRLRLYLVAPYRVNFSTTKSGTLQGSSFSYTGGASGTGEWLLNTRYVWVSHNADGSKTQNLSANFSIDITFSGSWLGTLSVSGNAVLNNIPRASSVSLSNFNVSASSLSVTVTKASSGFTHDFTLYFGTSDWIAEWYISNKTSSTTPTLSLNSNIRHRLTSRMPNTTSASVRIRCRTFNGSTHIGTSYDTATVTIPNTSSYQPSIDSLNIGISGNGRDKTIGKYVQNISKADVDFTSTVRAGATVKSRRITIDGTNYNGNNVTSNVLRNAKTVTITARVEDSRGRVATSSDTITVHAYKPPTIDNFSAVRDSDAPANVVIMYSATWTPLETDNDLTLKINRGDINLKDDTASGIGAVGSMLTSVGNSVTSSYSFSFIATDTFGNSASAIATVSTQKVVIDIHKNEGVGIGKMHEQGSLDIGGDVYINDCLVPYFTEWEEW